MCGESQTIVNLDIRVPNETRYLSLVGNLAELIVKEIDTGSEDRETLAYHLNLVVTEAVTNAIQYGAPVESGDCVRILLSCEDKDLCVRVFDQGQGFDLSAVSAAEAEDLSERGRGLFFIRALMDSVDYRRTENGNVLEMKKRFS